MSTTDEHRRADADHAPDHDPDVDQCLTCGLATTSDGKHHGDDEPATRVDDWRGDLCTALRDLGADLLADELAGPADDEQTAEWMRWYGGDAEAAAAALVTEETWLLFDDEDDEEASHAASVTKTDDGYRVGWWNEAVGQVTNVDFDNLEDAHYWLEDAGYIDFTA